MPDTTKHFINVNSRSRAVDARTTHHRGYTVELASCELGAYARTPPARPTIKNWRASHIHCRGIHRNEETRRIKRRAWTKQDIRELKMHSRIKSRVKTVVRAMKRTVGALRQKASSLGLLLGHRR